MFRATLRQERRAAARHIWSIRNSTRSPKAIMCGSIKRKLLTFIHLHPAAKFTQWSITLDRFDPLENSMLFVPGCRI